MKDEKTVNAYNKIADDYKNRNSNPFYTNEYETFLRFFREGKKIIEIGCGIGRDAEKLIENGFVYTGIDASDGMLALARERVPSADFRCMDFYTLSFPDECFDGFWTAATLLHVPKENIKDVLQNIKRIVKPKGIGFISVKEKTTMDEGIIKEKKSGGIERYFSFYEEGEFGKILKENGFEVMDSYKKLENDTQQTVWLCFFVRKN
jgi:ubiquinone/menaquinone biosynthesis C-methylase UbiE